MLSTSLMGQTGPLGRFAGYGNIGAAMSGFQSLVGWPDRFPFGPYGPYSDYVAPRFALVILLAALDRREETGEGCHIDSRRPSRPRTSLRRRSPTTSRPGESPSGSATATAEMAPHGVYPSADGRLGGDRRARRRRLARARRSGSASPTTASPRRPADSRTPTSSTSSSAAWTAAHTAAAVERLLQERGVPAHVAIDSDTALARRAVRVARPLRRARARALREDGRARIALPPFGNSGSRHAQQPKPATVQARARPRRPSCRRPPPRARGGTRGGSPCARGGGARRRW